MALPKKKSTRTRRRTRASHFALKKISLVTCPKCKKAKMQHRVCVSCGFYKGRDVLRLDAKLQKKLKRVKEKAQ